MSTPSPSLLAGQNGRMLALISSGIGLHAFNQFAIVAAMPLAAAELGGRDWFSWVYSLYFIGSIAGGTSAAALRDRLGIRNSLLLAAFVVTLVLFTALTRPQTGGGPSARLSPASIGLSLVAALSLSLSSAGTGIAAQAGLLALGLALLVAMVVLDGRLGPPLFPSGLTARGSALGRGFLILFLMSAGHSAGSTYLALLVREVFALAPALVGYVIVTMALTWSAVAMLAARATGLAARHRLMRSGPLFQCAGFAAIAAGIGMKSLSLVILGQMLVGTGFGLSWASVNQAAMEAADGPERDRASALLPTMSTAGYAVGAAISGTIAAATSLTASLATGSAGDTATWLYGVAALGALVSFALGLRLRLKA